MNIEVKKLSGSEVEISGEIPAEEFEKSWDEALKQIGEKTRLDGFRPGKAPEKVLIEKVGEGEILETAAELCLKKTWPKIVAENKIEALGQPEIVITKLARQNPLGFKIKTAVLPEVKLADYKKIAGEVMSGPGEEITVAEKEIEGALEYLRKSRAKTPAGGGSSSGGGGELPELNDEFAKSLGSFENLEALKKNMRENIKLEKTIKAREKKRMELLDLVAASSQIEVPAILVEAEKEKMFSELKGSLDGMGLSWEHYLDHIKKTQEDLAKEWTGEAEKRVRYGLTLREIARTEKIEVAEAELEKETEYFLSRYLPEERAKLDLKRIKDYAYGIVRNEKVFKLLENHG